MKRLSVLTFAFCLFTFALSLIAPPGVKIPRAASALSPPDTEVCVQPFDNLCGDEETQSLARGDAPPGVAMVGTR